MYSFIHIKLYVYKFGYLIPNLCCLLDFKLYRNDAMW